MSALAVLKVLAPYNPVAPLNFGERCDMTPEKQPRHALFVRWKDYELGAFGVPAIVAVIMLALIGARWLGVI
jgi:hypothetical protein